MHTHLLEHIRRFVTLSDDEAALISHKLIVKKLKKKEMLLEPGKVCRANYFVSTGCMRMYFINKKGQEQTTQFGLENWWIADYDSFNNNNPAQFYIQAVENSELIVWDKNAEAELIKAIPQLGGYFRRILEKAYAASQRRIQFIYGLTDEERYRIFSTAFPGFVQRVPQYMLASYLGFTPQFLSKIRAKKVW